MYVYLYTHTHKYGKILIKETDLNLKTFLKVLIIVVISYKIVVSCNTWQVSFLIVSDTMSEIVF